MREYRYDLELGLHQEVAWTEIAPLLEELQNHPNIITLRVRRQAFRIAAGGEIPVLLHMFMGALVFEVVRDAIYPKLKETFYSIYRKLPGLTPSGKAWPMRITISESELEVSYQLPEGLSDVELAEALGSISVHFASLRSEEDPRHIFTYDAESRSWVPGLIEKAPESA